MVKIEEQAKFYDRRWSNFGFPNRLQLIRMVKILEYLSHVPSYTEVCDLGCGAGWASGVIGHLANVLGVDLSDVDDARRRYPHCKFITADILDWDHPRSRFDVVVSQEVIEHIPYPRQIEYLRVAHGLLRPGGHLILTTPNKRTMNAISSGGRSWSDQPIEDWLDRRTLLRKLENAEFKVVRQTSIILGVGNLGAYRIINSAKVNNALRVMGGRDLWRRTFCAAGFGLHFVVLAQKSQS